MGEHVNLAAVEKDVSRNDQLALVLCAAAFAQLMATSRITRFDVSMEQDSYFVFRIAQILAYFLLAFLFRRTLAPVRTLVGAALGLCGSYLFLSVAAFYGVVSNAFIAPSLALARIAFGVGLATSVLVALHVLSTFSYIKSMLAITAASLLMEAFIVVSGFVPDAAVGAVQPVLLIGGLLCLVAGVRIKEHTVVVPGDHPLQYGVNYDTSTSERPISFLVDSRDWTFQMIVAFFLPAVFGFFSQLTSSSGHVGVYNGPLFELAGFLSCLLVFLVCLLRKPRWDFPSMFVSVAVLYTTGLALLPILWDSGVPIAGALIACGLNVYKSLLLVLIARKSFDDPRHTYLYAGVFMGYANALYGRMLEPALVGNLPVNYQLISTFSLVCLWLLGMVCLVLFVLQGKPFSTVRHCNVSETIPVAPAPGTPADPFVRGIEVLSETASLSPREREVLIQTLHGYTMAGVADVLSISTETVRTHMKRIYAKTGVSSKQELIKRVLAASEDEK